MIDYKTILGIPRVENDVLILDFSGITSLHTFEITELFFQCIALEHANALEVRHPNKVTDYLARINFFSQLAHQKKFPEVPDSLRTGMQNPLLELQVYTFKPEFYGDYEKIFTTLGDFGLSEDSASLVISSLAEIIDNAFLHNLGLWNEKTGPLVSVLMHDDPEKREVCVSICDAGVGFLRTLHRNYPALNNEADAITLALRSNTTGRSNHRGGNGLVYLQKNVFNGFAGELCIRSKDTLMRVEGRDNAVLEKNDLPFDAGANIFFRIQY